MTNDSWPRRLIRLIAPVILYEIIIILVQAVMMSVWTVRHLDNYLAADSGLIDQALLMNDLLNYSLRYGLLMQTIASIPAILLFLRMIRKDIPGRRFAFDASAVPLRGWILLPVLGLCLSMAGNSFLNIGTFAESSEAFEQASEILFSGPLAIQLIGIGLLIPCCEELLFRGILYLRMRQYTQVNLAIFVSAVIFALIHGNIVQGIYAFVLGMVLAWLYEKYGSLKAPVLTHIFANLSAFVFSAALSLLPLQLDGDLALIVMGMFFSAICAILILYLNKTVETRRIYADPV